MSGRAALVLLLSAAVFLVGVESQQRVCYSGPPPEADPDNPDGWMKQAMQEIRKNCPGRRQPCPADTEWCLVFKGMAGTGVKLYDMWTSLDWNPRYQCIGHQRDNALYRAWSTGQLNIRRVKLSLYDSTGVRAELIFNGTGSDIKSWFTQNRLISSPWEDLKSAQLNNGVGGQNFSIDGHAFLARRFFINLYYKTCEVDLGWLIVTSEAKPARCPWEEQTADYPYPIILYSTTDSKVLWNDLRSKDASVGRADSLTIHIDTE